MLTLEERLAVVNLYEELGSYRAVAAVVGCDHKTVKAVIERGRRVADPPRWRRRLKLTDPFLEMVEQKVENSQGRIRSRPLLRLLKAAGYEGSLRTLQRALAVVKREWKRTHMRVYRPWASGPGEFLIVDFGEVGKVETAAGRRTLSCFCAVLGWSRWRYLRFFTCQRFQVLAQGLAGCFEAMGGVSAKVMFDNPKTVTDYFVMGLSVLHPDLVRLAAHYHFSPITAAAADPESKGKVEALVRYVKSDCVPDEGFDSEAAANAWGMAWSDEVNAEVHSETRAVPAQRLEAERRLLRALPERPAVASGEGRTVDRKFSTIRIGCARYSVPDRLRGLEVEVMVDGQEVRILHRGGEVALHELQPPGGMSIKDEHYSSPRPTGIRPLRARLPEEVAFLELGNTAEAYLRAAAAAGTPRLKAQLQDVLQLVRSHGREAVLAALERATHFGRFGTHDLRSILASGPAAPPTKPAEVLPLPLPDLPAVPQRQLESYRW